MRHGKHDLFVIAEEIIAPFGTGKRNLSYAGVYAETEL
jgi:hypothetical protein